MTNNKQLATVAKTIAAHHKGKPLCVLADVSGSMFGLNETGMSRFAELKEALTTALAGRTDFTLIEFDDRIELREKPQDLICRGGVTRLADALIAVKKQGAERLLIVTDGAPTDAPSDSCLAVLDTAFPWVRVDVLFVGNENDKGALALMKAVARNGGEVMTARKRYLEGIRLLLGERSAHNG